MVTMKAVSLSVLLLHFAIGYAQPTASQSVQQILANQRIWGKDLPTALANIRAMREIGEKQVVVFHDSIQTTAGTRPEQADVNLETVQKALNSISRTERATLRDALGCKNTPFKPMCLAGITPSAEHFKKIEESNGITLSASSSKLQFLEPDATIDTVQKELGKPEQVTQEVIQTKYERRPVILTKYKYASGNIIFATSNLTPNGKLDRVLMSTDILTTVLQHK